MSIPPECSDRHPISGLPPRLPNKVWIEEIQAGVRRLTDNALLDKFGIPKKKLDEVKSIFL